MSIEILRLLKITECFFAFLIILLFNVCVSYKLQQHVATAQTNPISVPSRFIPYRNLDYNYTIQRPLDWKVEDKQPNSVSLHPSNALVANQFYPNITITVSAGFSKSPFMIADTLREFKGIEFIKDTPFIYKGNTGFHLVYTTQNLIVGELTVNRILVSDDKWNYDLAVAARTDDYQKLLPAIQFIFSSFTTSRQPPLPYAMSESTGKQILNTLQTQPMLESTGKQILSTLKEQTKLLQTLQPQTQKPTNVTAPDIKRVGCAAVSTGLDMFGVNVAAAAIPC